MDSAEDAAAKFSSLYAELAAKSSRVAELEARVSALETENAGLKEALAEATGSTGGDEHPVLRGIKQEAVEKRGGGVARDAIEVSGDEEGAAAVGTSKGGSQEEGVGAVSAPRKRVGARESEGEADAEGGGGSSGESSAGLEDDDVSVTPRGMKRGRGAGAARVVTSDSEDDGGGGGGEDVLGNGKDDGDDQKGLMSSRKRAFRRVSDSEDEDGNGGVAEPEAESKDKEDVHNMVPIYELLKRVPKERPSEDGDESDDAKGHSAPTTRRSARLARNQSKSNRMFHGVSDSEDDDGNEGIDNESDDAKGHSAPATRRSARLAKNQSKSNHVFHGVCDSEDDDGSEGTAAPQTESGDEEEDDTVPIYRSLKKMPKERPSDDGDESDVAKGHSAPASRHSARLVKSQSKGRRPACPGLHFVEPPKDVEGSEDDMEDDDMNEFINDDSCDNASDSADESGLNEKSSSGLEVSDGEVDYKDVMACIGRKKKAKEWDYQADMLAAFSVHPELCLKAVCAMYRKQTEDEQVEKASLFHNKQGFSHKDAPKGSRIAEFLLDGDRDGPLKKTVSDLDEYDRYAFKFCHKVASHYSKQLFSIYQNKEDPYFHP